MINPQSTHGLKSSHSVPPARHGSFSAAMLNADHEEWLAALLSSMSVALNQMAAASIEQSLAGYGFLRNALNMRLRGEMTTFGLLQTGVRTLSCQENCIYIFAWCFCFLRGFHCLVYMNIYIYMCVLQLQQFLVFQLKAAKGTSAAHTAVHHHHHHHHHHKSTKKSQARVV